MNNVIYLKPYYEDKDITPIAYNRALDEDDYAIWKSRQLHTNNITILDTDVEGWEDEE